MSQLSSVVILFLTRNSMVFSICFPALNLCIGIGVFSSSCGWFSVVCVFFLRSILSVFSSISWLLNVFQAHRHSFFGIFGNK